MKQSFTRQLDGLARDLLPLASTLILIIIGAVPLHLPGLQSVAPALPMIAVFYWALHRPDLMPPVAAFAIGLFQDILSGAAVGIGAAIYVLLHAGVHSQRAFFHGKPFVVLWPGFAVAAISAAFLSWLMMSTIRLEWVDGRSALLQAVTTIGCFPLLVRALWRCHVSLLRQA